MFTKQKDEVKSRRKVNGLVTMWTPLTVSKVTDNAQDSKYYLNNICIIFLKNNLKKMKNCFLKHSTAVKTEPLRYVSN